MNRILKYASLLVAAVMLLSCEGNDPSGEGILTLTSDKNLIQTFGGDYALLTVKLDGKVVSDGVTFFDGNNEVLDISDFKFVTDMAGEYEIWANYGTSNSETITIKAISVAIPETPADPQPSNTSFETRVLLTEFTTVGCTACPGMKILLEEAFEDEDFAGNVVAAECHPGLINSVADPCYIHTGFNDFCSIGGYPTVNLDMYTNFANYTLPKSEFVSQVDALIDAKEDVAAGIAVNSSYKDGQMVIKATIKAAVAGNYRVGAFLLEDGVYAKQHGGQAQPWMDNHDGVIRYIDSKYIAKTGGERYYGFSVGEVPAGGTADYVFVWMLDEIWAAGSEKAQINGGGKPWEPYVLENLHLAVFVSSTSESGDYYVNNVIDCPINGMTPFEYK